MTPVFKRMSEEDGTVAESRMTPRRVVGGPARAGELQQLLEQSLRVPNPLIPRGYGYMHLKHARLPIPPRPQNNFSIQLA